MKTIEEIIEYLQMELAEANESQDQARGHERLFYMMKARFITELLEEIKR